MSNVKEQVEQRIKELKVELYDLEEWLEEYERVEQMPVQQTVEEEKVGRFASFREQTKNAFSELKGDTNDALALKCPHCRSKDVTFSQNKRKGFSVGKAVGGTVLTGGIGSLAGFAGKKGKDQYHCNNCGRVFDK